VSGGGWCGSGKWAQRRQAHIFPFCRRANVRVRVDEVFLFESIRVVAAAQRGVRAEPDNVGQEHIVFRRHGMCHRLPPTGIWQRQSRIKQVSKLPAHSKSSQQKSLEYDQADKAHRCPLHLGRRGCRHGSECGHSARQSRAQAPAATSPTTGTLSSTLCTGA